MTPWERLEVAACAIEQVPESTLTDPDRLSLILAGAGLYTDGRMLYGKWRWAEVEKEAPGLWQHPMEFARLLIRVARDKPVKILDVGAFHGFGSVLMGAFFRRFNPNALVIAIDKYRCIPALPYPMRRIVYRPGTTSDDYKNSVQDFVFIDAEHTYDAASHDYQRLKASCSIGFHDIADNYIEYMDPKGGVPALWQDLKETRSHEEFLDAEPGWMGIGLLT